MNKYYESKKEYLGNGKFKSFYYHEGTDIKSTEFYYDKGCNLHRDGDKPAIIECGINGEVVSKQYYVNGVDVTRETEIRLKRIEILKQLEA